MPLPRELCYSITDIRLLKRYDSYSSFLQYFNFVTSIVICLVGLLGNAVVICFLGFIMKKHESKYWFLNMAIADFLALLTLPFHAISSLKGSWTFGPQMCKLFFFSLCANMYSSIYILIALNIAKVLSVTKPMFHLKFISRQASVLICMFIWFIITLLCLPMFFYSGELKIGETILCSYLAGNTFDSVAVNNTYNVSSENTTRDILFSDISTRWSPYIEHCESDTCCGGEEALKLWNQLILHSKWMLTPFLIIGYFIPLGIVIISNITIIVHVRKSKTINTHRLYRFVLIIIMVYFISWTPVVIAEFVLFIAILNLNFIIMFNVLTFAPLLINIAYAHSCLNPILYVLTGERMRTELSEFLNSIRNICK